MKYLISKFRRITTTGNYIAEIDGIRFVAIMLVLYQHLHERLIRRVGQYYQDVPGSAIDDYLISGGVGVALFFSLSGYILFRILEKPIRDGGRPNLKQYFLRRITRLEPPYIIISTSIFIILVLGLYKGSGHFLGKGDHTLIESYLATITYTHTIIFGTPPSVNPPGWSLETEVQFYILAPFLTIAISAVKKWLFRITLLTITIFLWPFIIGIHVREISYLSFSILHWLPFFLVGFVVFELQKNINVTQWNHKVLMDVLTVLSMTGLIFVRDIEGSALYLWQCLLIGIFIYGVMTSHYIRRLLSINIISTIGGMCYTLYLIHVPVEEFAVRITSGIGVGLNYFLYILLQSIIVFPLVLVVGAIFFLLIEKPCMHPRWPWKLIRWVKHK